MKNLAQVNSPNPAQSREAVDFFLEAIADAIADRLEYRQSTKHRVLDAEKTSEYLGISENQLYNLVSEGKITPVRFDRRLRFDVRDLDQLIDEAKARRAG